MSSAIMTITLGLPAAEIAVTAKSEIATVVRSCFAISILKLWCVTCCVDEDDHYPDSCL